MWNFGIGVIELALLLIVVPAVVFTRSTTRRWCVAILCVTALGIVLTPSDPMSTLLVAVPLLIAYALGVVMAPFFRNVNVS
jgi:Sec-independent protein secretion pathway component TatC